MEVEVVVENNNNYDYINRIKLPRAAKLKLKDVTIIKAINVVFFILFYCS